MPNYFRLANKYRDFDREYFREIRIALSRCAMQLMAIYLIEIACRYSTLSTSVGMFPGAFQFATRMLGAANGKLLRIAFDITAGRKIRQNHCRSDLRMLEDVIGNGGKVRNKAY